MESQSTQPERSVGQLLAWILFCLVCVNLALSQWYFVVIAGEKTNLFFGLLASATLLVTMLTVRNGHIRAGPIEIAVSLILLGLAAASGMHSAIPVSSSARAFVLMSTGLGGFWCARIVLDTPSRQKTFVWLCVGILIALIGLSLAGQTLLGTPNALISTLYKNAHPLAHMLLLLAFAPLALIGTRRFWPVLIGVTLLILTGLVLFYCATTGSVASGVLLAPLIVVVVLFTAKGSRVVGLTLILLTLLVAFSAHFVSFSAVEGFSNPTYQSYRIESYPYSWHVAKNHPLLGLGLRAPREHLLEDYEPWHPKLPKEAFRDYLVDLVTPENNFLALLTGCGIPFTVVYVSALLILLVRLVRSVERPPPGLAFHPLVLLVSLSGSLLHSLTTDTMMHGQLCWFFHIFLGLIPKPSEQLVEQKKSIVRSTAFRIAGMVGAVIVGIVIGTHPALAPGKLDISSYLKKIPILSAFYDFGDAEIARVAPDSRVEKPAALLPGSLLVKFHDLNVGWETWEVAFILDNSESMASRSDPWEKSRFEVARDLVQQISGALPPESRIAVRCFTDELSLKMGSKEIPLTVSRRIYGWAKAPFAGLAARLEGVTGVKGPLDLCKAVVGSTQRDFGQRENLTPRIILLTDGESRCLPTTVAEIIKMRKQNRSPRVDVIALGVQPAAKQLLVELCQATEGKFLDLDSPQRVQATLSEYASILRVAKPVTVEISGSSGVKRVVVGEEIQLPPGLYSLWLPGDLNVPKADQVIDNIEVSAEKLTTVTVSKQDGRVMVSSTRR